MLYCVSGDPCSYEVLAIFPQEEVKAALCEIARPAIGDAIREKAPPGVTVTLSCGLDSEDARPSYRPSTRKDERLNMLTPEGKSPAEAVRDFVLGDRQ